MLRFITVNKTSVPQFRDFSKYSGKYLIFFSFIPHKWCRWCRTIIVSSSFYAIPELHAVKVLFFAESVGVVTSGHMTKMAVKSFDPPLPKTPCYTQTLRLYLLQNWSYCRLNFLHCGNTDFRVFLRKIIENITFPICVAKLMQMMPKHICWPVFDFSSLYAAGVIRIQGVVLRRIG